MEQIRLLNSGSDQSDRKSIRSFVLFPSVPETENQPASVDLLVADTLDDAIWRYRRGDPFWTAEGPVWQDDDGAVLNDAGLTGPLGPDGMSLGPSFVSVLSSTSNVPPSVWLLPWDVETDAFGLPVLLDSDFEPAPAGSVQAVEDTLVSGVNVGLSENDRSVAVGDVLVVVSDNAMVLRYSGQDVADHLADAAGGGPIGDDVSPTVLLDSTDFGGREPSGVAFRPDGSMLVATSGGDVLWFDYDGDADDWVPHDPASFTSGQGQGKYRIRVTSFRGAYYVVMANNRGELLVYGDPPAGGGVNDPLKVITDGIQQPHGLAVSDVVGGFANCVLENEGCDLLGDAAFNEEQQENVFNLEYLPDGEEEGISGGLVLQTCRVAADPRLNPQLGDNSCTPADAPLSLYDVCPQFGDPAMDVTIPWELCGIVDSNGEQQGFAVVEAAFDSFTQADNRMRAQLFPENLLGSDVSLDCQYLGVPPQNVSIKEGLGWAPIPGSEAATAAEFVAQDILAGCNSPGRTAGRSGSYWFLMQTSLEGVLVGDPIKKEELWSLWQPFLQGRYQLISDEIVAAIDPDGPFDPVPLDISVVDTAEFVDEFNKCMDRSSREALRGQRKGLERAAARLIDCDFLVAQDFNHALFNADATDENGFHVNSYGTIRMWLVSLYFAIQVKLLGEQPATGLDVFSGFYDEAG
jgi:hypothetical protein